MKIARGIVFLLFASLIISCHKPKPLFELISQGHSNIDFNNLITENDSVNPFDVTNMYNGGGIGIGDFNNDGLADIYFTGSQVPSILYLNKGNFEFQDVSAVSNTGGEGRWCRGVAVVDINNDGWQDIYVCTTIWSDPKKRQNLLYINKGLDRNHVPVFQEMGAAYGLNDDSYSTMASFFDYDNDGDLDVYITVNETLQDINPSIYRPKITDGSFPSTGRLYRNDWSDSLHHAFFTNTTKQAGVTIEGYGHGATIADFNRDGWKDIFVTNDFISNDLLYINNHDGTFTDKAASYFKHTSSNGMGQDVIDINNDGLSDVVELDMDPEDNYRKKLLMSGYNYLNYQNNDLYGYQYQYVRNSLQINQGPRVTGKDSIGDPIFSDIGFFSGISSTDWSWTPLVQDFDNDGFRDIIVTNGFPKDLTDHDFIAFREKSFAYASKKDVLSKIPQVKIKNYGFHNNGNLKFTDESANWGFTTPSFSNGAVYADLDNDGDLDMVVNNINDNAFLYRNNAREENDDSAHYLSVILKGDSMNLHGLGTWIDIYCSGQHQTLEQTPYRGYLSSVQNIPHFGLGKTTRVDSVVIRWPDFRRELMLNVTSDQQIVADHKNAKEKYRWTVPAVSPMFEDVTDSLGISYVHKETDFIDFNIQKLIPHKMSEYDPGLAAGDLNQDGLDDIVIGGSRSNATTLLMQQPSGKFLQKDLAAGGTQKLWKDMGVTVFDADGDGDPDIYTASGGYEDEPNSVAYRDMLYINDGHGNFRSDTVSLPKNFTSKSCVRPCDFDHDGDLDLFVAGRVSPWNYPQAVSSFMYRNDSKNGHVKFTDITDSAAGTLVSAGMICDAVWSDFDNDGWEDLVMAGEWLPVRILKNDHGRFKDITGSTGIGSYSGWWNSIIAGDFDNDGDMDYVAGNLGENSFYKGDRQHPVSVYGNEFYKPGSVQCVVTQYLKDKEGGELKEYTTHGRDDVIEQLPFIKKRFLTYKDFAKASFNQLFTPEELKNGIKYSANYFRHVFIRNDGNGHFTMIPLPGMAQFSAINGMVADDFDGDGYLDICLNTNDYGADPSNGRYDALNGLVLRGDGKGNFSPLTIIQSGIFIPGNGRGLAKLRGRNESYLLAATQNKGPMKVFSLRSRGRIVPLKHDDVSAILHFPDGSIQKTEVGYGSSFLSQSGRFLYIGKKVSSVEIFDKSGRKRQVEMGNAGDKVDRISR